MSTEQTKQPAGGAPAESEAATAGDERRGVVIGILICVLAALLAFFAIHTLG